MASTTRVVVLLCCCSLILSCSAAGNGQERASEEHPTRTASHQQQDTLFRPPKSIIDAVKSLFYSPSAPDHPPASPSIYWTKLRSLLNPSPAPSSSAYPNLDFRDSREGKSSDDDDGAGEKVREAVARSLDKSRTALEDSAKLAAKLAGETVDRTANKLKKTLSGRVMHHHHDEGEL